MRTYIPKGMRSRKERYLELIHFSRQYPKWKQENTNIRLEYRASMNGSIAVQSSGNGISPVEAKADRLIMNDEKIELVEACCRDACIKNPSIYPSLMKVVTEGLPVERSGAPVGRKTMYRYKDAYFELLDSRKI